MKPKTFDHDGLTFIVRPRTGFDEAMSNALLLDVGKLVLEGLGFDIDGQYPRSLDLLIAAFVRWMQVTSIEGDTILKDVAIINLPSHLPELFADWQTLVTENSGECWVKWNDAYNAANPATPDPEESGGAQESTKTTTT